MSKIAPTISESTFLSIVTADTEDPKHRPWFLPEVADKYVVPLAPKKDAFVPKNDDCLEEEYSAELVSVDAKKKAYQDNFTEDMRRFVAEAQSAIYLVYQPVWSCKTNTLVGMEVLCRVANGKDDAPMPALANFQADPSLSSLQLDFTRKQLEFAACACKALPGVWVSVNIRPNELAALADDLLATAAQTTTEIGFSNLRIEVTEYAPITSEVLALIAEMKKAGVRFALDDVNEVREHPVPPAMAGPSHACSMALAKEHAALFALQKLATPMSCSVFRKEVFPTPQYAGGKPVPYLRSLILPEEDKDGIEERNMLVESWVQDVSRVNPKTEFVIECSVYQEDLQQGRAGLYPAIPLFESGTFHIQGGRTGGRGFQLDTFLLALEREQIQSDDAAMK